MIKKFKKWYRGHTEISEPDDPILWISHNRSKNARRLEAFIKSIRTNWIAFAALIVAILTLLVTS